MKGFYKIPRKLKRRNLFGFRGTQFSIDRVKNYGNKQVWQGHQVYDSVVYTLCYRSICIALENCSTHSALGR
jgi:hypothetical protein